MDTLGNLIFLWDGLGGAALKQTLSFIILAISLSVFKNNPKIGAPGWLSR